MYTLLPSWLSPSLLWFVIPFQGADTFVPFFFSLLQLSFVGGWVYLFGLFSLFHFGYFLCEYISLILFCTVPILPFIPSRVFFISYSAFHLRSSIWVCSFFFFLPVLLRYDWYTTQCKVLGVFFFGVYLFLMATLAAYGSSWTGNWILAVAASYASNTRSLTSVPGRGLNLHPNTPKTPLIPLCHRGNSYLFYNSCSNKCEVVCHCDFDLQFLDD